MSTNKLPSIPADDQALVKLDKANQAFIKAWELHDAELDAAAQAIAQKHNYFILMAQSVLLEAQANAAREGFSMEEMHKVMGCECQH